MMNEKESLSRNRLAIVRLADEANERFVTAMQALMRVLTWHVPSPSKRAPRGAVTSNPGFANRERATHNRTEGRPCGIEPQQLAALAGQVDHVLRRRRTRQEGVTGDGGENTESPSNGIVAIKLRELFHPDARLRLRAADWFRETRCHDALSALESVLLIEEQHEVRMAILLAIGELEPKARHGS